MEVGTKVMVLWTEKGCRKPKVVVCIGGDLLVGSCHDDARVGCHMDC